MAKLESTVQDLAAICPNQTHIFFPKTMENFSIWVPRSENLILRFNWVKTAPSSSMERTERQRPNHPPNRSFAPSESSGSSSSTSRRNYSNRSRNSDYKYSKYNTNSNRSFEDGSSDWRSKRSSGGKMFVQKLETKDDSDCSHFDLPPVIVGTCPFMCPGKLKPSISSSFFILWSSLFLVYLLCFPL